MKFKNIKIDGVSGVIFDGDIVDTTVHGIVKVTGWKDKWYGSYIAQTECRDWVQRACFAHRCDQIIHPTAFEDWGREQYYTLFQEFLISFPRLLSFLKKSPFARWIDLTPKEKYSDYHRIKEPAEITVSHSKIKWIEE